MLNIKLLWIPLTAADAQVYKSGLRMYEYLNCLVMRVIQRYSLIMAMHEIESIEELNPRNSE